MHGVEDVENILEFSELSASFFVVKKQQDKGGKCQIFRVEET